MRARLAHHARPSQDVGYRTVTLLGMGAFVSAYAVGLLVHQVPIASIAGHSMSYHYQDADTWQTGIYLVLYLIPTIAPFFVSHLERAKLLGVAFLFGLLASLAFRLGALASVWCFFSALLSGLTIASIELTLRRMRRSQVPVLVDLANEIATT